MSQPSAVPPQFHTGDILNHSLELKRHVATGGFAEIWKARQVRTGDRVAVKILLAKGHGRPNMELRMTREVEILNRIRHPHVVQYKGHDRVFARHSPNGENLPCPLGCPFLVLEWVSGQSLGGLMRRRRREGALGAGLLSLAEASLWFGQIVDALAEAHRLGILHRDITPGNVFIRGDGRALLLDWNLAVARESRDITVFNNPQGAGTPYYAAPEQVDSLASANETADVYSLAVVMIKALTGESLKNLSAGCSDRLLNRGRVRRKLQCRGSGSLAAVPESLIGLLLAALNRNPAARPQSVVDFLPLLEQAAAGDRTAVLERRASSNPPRPFLPAPPIWQPAAHAVSQQRQLSDNFYEARPTLKPPSLASAFSVAATIDDSPVPSTSRAFLFLRTGTALRWFWCKTRRAPLTGMFAAAVVGSGLTTLLAYAWG